MKRPTEKTLTIILVHVIVVLSIIAYIVNPNAGVTPKYVDVRFGGLVDVRTFVKPMKIKEITSESPSIKEIYDAVETSGYHYTPDSYSLVGYGGMLVNNLDFWLYGAETLQLWRQSNHNLYVDCECGSIFLCSLLRGYGYDARVFIGTVTVDGETYGHGWVEVRSEGQWILIESTMGKPLTKEEPRPSFYRAAYSFNDTNTRYYIVSGVEEFKPPVPPTLIERLRDLVETW